MGGHLPSRRRPTVITAIPISTRLKAVLEMRRLHPAGKPLASERYVFGNAVGEQVQSRGRAWYTAILKAMATSPPTRLARTSTRNRAPRSERSSALNHAQKR